MKKLGLIFSFGLLFSAHASAQDQLPLANWAAVESKDDFLNCSTMDEAQLIHPWGELVTVEANLEKMDYFFDPQHLPNQNLRYFCMNLKDAKKPDAKHTIVKSSKALSIKSFVHVRDYEKNEIDGKLSSYSSGDFDVVHVIALTDSQIKAYEIMNPQPVQKNKKPKPSGLVYLNRALEDQKNGKKSFYDKEEYEKWRKNVLYYFKTIAQESHKIVKGPFDSGKDEPDTEEEWGSLEKAGSQFMCYSNGGCAFFNLENLAATDTHLYVLFFGGDGTSDLDGFKYNTFGELDDVMGLIKIPTSALQTLESKYAYYQYDSSVQNPMLDFAVEFEVVNTLD